MNNIPILRSGESVELKLVVKVMDTEAMYKRCPKYWHFWHPVIWRDATEADFKDKP